MLNPFPAWAGILNPRKNQFRPLILATLSQIGGNSPSFSTLITLPHIQLQIRNISLLPRYGALNYEHEFRHGVTTLSIWRLVLLGTTISTFSLFCAAPAPLFCAPTCATTSLAAPFGGSYRESRELVRGGGTAAAAWSLQTGRRSPPLNGMTQNMARIRYISLLCCTQQFCKLLFIASSGDRQVVSR